MELARQWLEGKQLQGVAVSWKEDVRKWHPGQQWIWQPGGLGVFDPGINALSIITHIVPEPLFVSVADLRFPANRQAPIAASLRITSSAGLAVSAELDWDHGQDELWRIDVQCAEGLLRLDHGGASLSVDGKPLAVPEEGEYPALYQHFADLLHTGRSDTDLQPLRLVADSFFVGSRQLTEPFND